MRGSSGASAWRPWGIAAAIGLACAVPGCFNPQPEPPAKSGSANEDAFSDAATGSGSTTGEGGSGGGGGASGAGPVFEFDLPPGVTVTTGGSTQVAPRIAPNPLTAKDAIDAK